MESFKNRQALEKNQIISKIFPISPQFEQLKGFIGIHRSWIKPHVQI
jgi:hypothetical protein